MWDAVKAVKETDGNVSEAARILGISRRTLRGRLSRAKKKIPQFTVESEDFTEASIDEIRERRIKEFNRKSKNAKNDRLLDVRLDVDGPFGICIFGDCHWDNPGTDLSAYEAHAESVLKTEGFYGGLIGDLTDNWVGRLEALYAGHTITPTEGWRLCEHYISEIAPKCLFLTGGNHDAWSGHRDPLTYMVRDTNIIYRNHRTRLRILQGRDERLTIHARHSFKGRSIYNQAHAALKELIFGCKDDIAVCGHYHISGLSVTKDQETGKKLQGVLVASYKIHDDFAESRGFSDQNLSPSVCFIVDTNKPRHHPDYCQLYWDPIEAADVLTWKRSRELEI